MASDRNPRARAELQALIGGAVVASAALFGLLWTSSGAGLPTPAKMVKAQFSVAILSGSKQAEQRAAQDVQETTDQALTLEQSAAAEVKILEQESQLPDAVAASPHAEPTKDAANLEEEKIIAPALISMPGGTLSSHDIDAGDASAPDPFAIAARQVYMRLFVDANGVVVRGGIIRSGPEPWRDALFLKAAKSRIYQTSRLLPGISRGERQEPTWQVDLVLDYDSASVLP